MAGLGTLPFLNSLSPLDLRWNYTLDVEVENTKGYIYIPKLLNDLMPIIITLPFSLSIIIIVKYRNWKKNLLSNNILSIINTIEKLN